MIKIFYWFRRKTGRINVSLSSFQINWRKAQCFHVLKIKCQQDISLERLMAGKVIMMPRVEGLCRLLSFILYYGPSGLLLILQKFSILRAFIDEEAGLKKLISSQNVSYPAYQEEKKIGHVQFVQHLWSLMALQNMVSFDKNCLRLNQFEII